MAHLPPQSHHDRAPSSPGAPITRWALDLGTRNTAVCRWNDALGRPELVALPEVCRDPTASDPSQAPLLVPSATHLVEQPDLVTRLARHRWLAPRVTWGREAWIGRQALERNLGGAHKAYVPSFKRFLGRASTTPLAQAGGHTIDARDTAAAFLRELLGEVHRTTGSRVRDLVVTAPVEAYESYRAELTSILRRLGVKRVRFADEPVAAALGYGLGLTANRLVLVVDFGAGTLDLALVRLTAREAAQGRCEVVAKSGRPVGGDHVDRWLLDAVAADLGQPLDPFWHGLLLDEACRVKEATYVRGEEVFHLHPDGVHGAMPGGPDERVIDQAYLRDVCERHGLFTLLDALLDEVLRSAEAQGVSKRDIDDVLMVGGSTLLPGVYGLMERRFGRDRVRAFRPFEAVAWGATALAADAWTHADFIVHDYAILTYDADTGAPQYLPVVRRGTRFPTRTDHWRNQLVPTCARGEPESRFRLLVCELGVASDDEQLYGFDAEGTVHRTRAGDERLVVPLNEASPVLGTLRPPHLPSDRHPRLDVSFGVNADRWLVTTVRDLKTDAVLLDSVPVVRLL